MAPPPGYPKRPAVSGREMQRATPIGALLAGGRSRRMGQPKATMELAGRPLAWWAARSLAAVADTPVQVGGPPLPDLGWPCWPDLRSHEGPAAGLETALARARSAVVTSAIDTPFISPALLRRALRAVRNGALAAVPHWRDRWHPLCAAYAPDMLVRLRDWLDAGNTDLQGLLRQTPVWRLGTATLLAFGDPDLLLLNVNGRDDLAWAEAALASGLYQDKP
ncbi:MAG: molybdenum cofactor guanylyltransferase [Acidobacteriota bacterium]